MQRWRRLRGVLAAVGAVLVISGLMSAGDAQVLPPDITFPTFPTFPPFPTTPTSPPPTMPPSTTSTTSPPPTMPPPTTTTTSPPSTSPPPTSPPTTVDLPDFDDEIEDIIRRLEEFGEVFADVIEDLRNLQDRF